MFLYPTVSTDNATYQTHEANSFCALVKSTLPASLLGEVEISTEPYVYQSAEDVVKTFLMYMKSLAQKVERLQSRQEPLKQML